MAFYSQWLWICFFSLGWVGWGDTVTFCCKKPFKDTGAPADLQLLFYFITIIFFQHFRRRNQKMALVVNLTQCPCLSSTICTCRITAFIRRTDCTVDILICHSMKNTSGLSSIKSPSKSPTVTGKQNTLEGSPLKWNSAFINSPLPAMTWQNVHCAAGPSSQSISRWIHNTSLLQVFQIKNPRGTFKTKQTNTMFV